MALPYSEIDVQKLIADSGLSITFVYPVKKRSNWLARLFK